MDHWPQHKTIKLLEENICDIGLGQGFSISTTDILDCIILSCGSMWQGQGLFCVCLAASLTSTH